MYELDKAAFGRFLAQLRREKGMTQKELAATLYVSDKAVSKWERGLSVPDISPPVWFTVCATVFLWIWTFMTLQNGVAWPT